MSAKSKAKPPKAPLTPAAVVLHAPLEPIRVARTAASQAPFLGPDIFSFPMIPVPGLGTMACDKYGRIYYDPAVLAGKWSPMQSATVMIHEVWHLVRQHFVRAEALGVDSAEAWNVATDAEINDGLVVAPFSLPPGGIFPSTIGQPEGKTAEQYYAAIKAAQPKSQQRDQRQSQPGKSQAQPESESGEGQGDGDESGEGDGSESTPGSASSSGPSNGNDASTSGSPTEQGRPGDSDGSADADGSGSSSPASGSPQSGSAGDPGGSSPGSSTASGGKGSRNERPWTPPENRGGCGGGSGVDGARRPWELPPTDSRAPAMSPIEVKAIQKRVAERVQQAASRDCGHVPAGLRRWASEVLAPAKIDWRRELASVIRAGIAFAAGAVDYSYARPNRRDTGRIINPALVRPVPRVGVVIDTSGSMGTREIASALSETQGVLRSSQAECVVVSCDTRSCVQRRVTSARQVVLQGGGGTDMGVGIGDAVKAHCKCVVVVTDGCTPWPREQPRGVRVIAAIVPGGSTEGIPTWIKAIKVEAS